MLTADEIEAIDRLDEENGLSDEQKALLFWFLTERERARLKREGEPRIAESRDGEAVIEPAPAKAGPGEDTELLDWLAAIRASLDWCDSLGTWSVIPQDCDLIVSASKDRIADLRAALRLAKRRLEAGGPA